MLYCKANIEQTCGLPPCYSKKGTNHIGLAMVCTIIHCHYSDHRFVVRTWAPSAQGCAIRSRSSPSSGHNVFGVLKAKFIDHFLLIFAEQT